jgi:hypothetical protein
VKDCFHGELEPFFEGSSLFFKEVDFSLGNIHVHEEKEFKLFPITT